MGLGNYINKNVLGLNFGSLLQKYDSDNDNCFTQKEFSNAISNMTGIFAKSIIKLTGFDKKYFKIIDNDKNKILTEKELAKYINDKYELDFYELKNLTVREVCNLIDEAEKMLEEKKIEEKKKNKIKFYI